jgi:ribonuclease G
LYTSRSARFAPVRRQAFARAHYHQGDHLPLPWFRRKKEAAEQAPMPAAALPEPLEETPPDVELAESPASAEDEALVRKKRRRGSRGGRGRKKKTDTATPEAADENGAATPKPKPATAARSTRKAAEPKAEKKTPEKAADKKRRERQPRRRPAPRRAPLPKAKRELLVSVDPGERRVAVMEDDRVTELYLERPERRSIAGNIYKGVVDNVLPGMEAAFVEIGLEKNGFLYVDEIVGPELEGRKGARKIQDLIAKGQEILVQAVKDPMKTKGARLTTEISLPGRFVVYVPQGEGLGVSRRLDDDERQRLKDIVKAIAPAKGGVIVRTAAEGASAEDVERDLLFLQRLWKTIEARAKQVKPPSLIYQEAELPLRVIRDLFTGDFEKAYVDHDRTHKRIVGYLKKTSPHMAERVIRYKEKESLLEGFGVDKEIKSTLSRRVDLPSGGYLIFDYAEAFTVIDVNTGRFVGSRSKTSAARLEDTITKNNLEAVKEVVRQLRLRDIGGIIVIDFIDMANPKNRATVEEALRQELERDRTKTYVVEISPLGLVEMTRQNVTDGPREVMTKKCPTCGGDGIVISEQTAAVIVERQLRGLAAPGSRTQAYRVEVNAKIAALVIGPAAQRLAEIEDVAKRRFFLEGKDEVHLDHFVVLEQGSLAKLKPESPVDEGIEVELKLGEVGLHDASAGVGKLDGLDVQVADAAKLVGKKVKVRVNRVLDGSAYAELLSPVQPAAAPITAEGEAEKPTRAARSRKEAPKESGVEEPAEESAVAAAEEEPAEAIEDEPDEAIEEAALEGEPDEAIEEAALEGEEPAAAPKKRTRRGTRGGRKRKKKVPGEPVAEGAEQPSEADEPEIEADVAEEAAAEEEVVFADESEAAAEPADAVEPESEPEADVEPESDAEADGEESSAPRIHVPDESLGREEGDEAEPPKKRTRRGSRGGRRRKKPAAATATAGPEEASAVDGEEAPAPEPTWDYVPMSEWESEIGGKAADV